MRIEHGEEALAGRLLSADELLVLLELAIGHVPAADVVVVQGLVPVLAGLEGRSYRFYHVNVQVHAPLARVRRAGAVGCDVIGQAPQRPVRGLRRLAAEAVPHQHVVRA